MNVAAHATATVRKPGMIFIVLVSARDPGKTLNLKLKSEALTTRNLNPGTSSSSLIMRPVTALKLGEFEKRRAPHPTHHGPARSGPRSARVWHTTQEPE